MKRELNIDFRELIKKSVRTRCNFIDNVKDNLLKKMAQLESKQAKEFSNFRHEVFSVVDVLKVLNTIF